MQPTQHENFPAHNKATFWTWLCPYMTLYLCHLSSPPTALHLIISVFSPNFPQIRILFSLTLNPLDFITHPFESIGSFLCSSYYQIHQMSLSIQPLVCSIGGVFGPSTKSTSLSLSLCKIWLRLMQYFW